MADMSHPNLFGEVEGPAAVAGSDPSDRGVDRPEPRVRRPDRRQMQMRACCLEELLESDHRARLVWSVAERLDLSGFYDRIEARGEVAGRAATDPKLLVGLWLYASIEGVGSARELARLCERHDAYRWLCGAVSVNHHSLSDFRVEHEQELDELLSQVIASLVDKGLVKVHRIAQDGMRIRAMAGAASFRKEKRLIKLLEQAKEHVAELKKQLEGPAGGGLSARKKAAMARAARERQQRLEEAMAQLPELKAKQNNPKNRKALRDKPVKASTTDAQARWMRMADGGMRPGYNVQLAMDTESRAIVGVDVTNVGSDNDQSAPMRQQVQQRSGQKVAEHLTDGNYLDLDQLEQAQRESVAMYVPAKQRKDGSDPYTPRPEDTQAIKAWRERMASPQGQEIYQLRSQTIETGNADLKTHRSLGQVLVRGMNKVRCVAIWCALAYNLLHFGAALLS